jgi:tetratricopeptide (TPR) repeat protein
MGATATARAAPGGARGRGWPGPVRGLARIGLGVALGLLVGCGVARGPSRGVPEPALRLSEVAHHGDPARRASMRLVLQGLDADAALRPAAALSSYERALQVDPNNPWAWLALARHEVEHGDPARALAELDKAEALLPAEGELSRGAAPHVTGLRGAALRAGGREPQGLALLSDARRAAPDVWADGSLDASELR